MVEARECEGGKQTTHKSERKEMILKNKRLGKSSLTNFNIYLILLLIGRGIGLSASDFLYSVFYIYLLIVFLANLTFALYAIWVYVCGRAENTTIFNLPQ